jgi:hypothetical protein
MFDNLVEFAEALIGHIVDKNIDRRSGGFGHQLLYMVNGHHGNPNIRYAFGINFNGQITPIG